MCDAPFCVEISEIIFTILHVRVLSLLAFALAIINVHKYYRALEDTYLLPGLSRPIFLIRSMNWTIFAIALFIFPELAILEARVLLRISLTFMIVSEIAYNWYFLIEMVKGAFKWTRSSLRSS